MCVCVFLLLALAGHAGVLYGGRDLGPELLLAGLSAAQGGEQALELVLTAGCPHEGLQLGSKYKYNSARIKQCCNVGIGAGGIEIILNLDPESWPKIIFF